MSVATTETYLRNAHAQWYNNDNYCGIADQSNFAMSYGGDGGGLGFGDNGKNTVGFGSMTAVGCSASDLACTRSEISQYGLNEETDTRLSTGVTWINGQASGKYDTWSVMAHETGHSLGFDHVFDAYDNVM